MLDCRFSVFKKIFGVGFGKFSRHILGSIRGIFSFLSVSSLFIGGTGFFKTFIGYFLLGVHPNFLVCFAVFLVSFSVYTLDKIADLDKDTVSMPARAGFLQGRKNLAIAYSSLAYLISIIIIFISRPISSLFLLVPMMANAAYGIRLIPGIPRLKDIPVMKNTVVAFSWALVTIMIPVTYQSHWKAGTFSLVVFMVLYFMFIKTFIDTVLYDIRDESGDRINNVRTIPVLMGLEKTILILLALNSTLLLVLPLFEGISWLLILTLVIYGYAYILYFRERRDPLALDFCVEGEWMLASLSLMAILGSTTLCW
ncbi:UbiA prenyltransferase family protein [uncultured archaeon]|nr:UbiA prenyltransferase family protein [uncultured archaeon]